MQDKWWDIAINPRIGCKHGCPYCWAKKMNNRFKWVKNWEEPQQKNWLYKLERIKKPKNIWIGNLTDMFGDWVSDAEIEAILKNLKDYPQHNFLFLTKNPKRYADFDFPKNCWKGATKTDKFIPTGIDFISVEPLYTNLQLKEWDYYKWVIVGGMSPKPVHKKEWIDDIVYYCKISNIPLYIKNNAHYPKVIKQFPKELRHE